MSPNAQSGKGPIVPPGDFPVSWADPAQESWFWAREVGHWPGIIPPLAFTILEQRFWRGFNRAAMEFGIPIHTHVRCVNGYFYMANVPTCPFDELPARGDEALVAIHKTMARLGQLWQDEWLPEVKQHLAAWDAFDREGASASALAAHLADTLDRWERLNVLHGTIAIPINLAPSMFDDLYRDLFGAGDAFQAYELLQGFDHMTSRTDRAFFRLGRRAASEPAVRQVFADSALDAIPDALAGVPGGRAFLAALDDFLQEYGQRNQGWTMSDPAWVEDPAPALAIVKEYMTLDDWDPEADLVRAAAQRDARVAEVRARLSGYPGAARDEFAYLLKAAQDAVQVAENHQFWIDSKCQYRVRRVLMEFGRRLVQAGALAAAGDVFYLDLDELPVVLDDPDKLDRERVARRAAELERFARITPPPVLGTLPDGPPPDDPLTRSLLKFFGAPPEPVADKSIIRGHAGSPGKVTGVARVIPSLAEASRLGRGEVLVTQMTSPPWTPLFRTAAAVVTDAGGVLSHPAIASREFGVPAVVGTMCASAIIQDGQRIEVDGNEGLVRILS